MRSFHTIAVPHRDILEGMLTMDVFAADLWGCTKAEDPMSTKMVNSSSGRPTRPKG